MSKEELIETQGGISWAALGVGGAIVTFLLGFLDGLVNPIKCGK